MEKNVAEAKQNLDKNPLDEAQRIKLGVFLYWSVCPWKYYELGKRSQQNLAWLELESFCSKFNFGDCYASDRSPKHRYESNFVTTLGDCGASPLTTALLKSTASKFVSFATCSKRTLKRKPYRNEIILNRLVCFIWHIS